MDGVDTLKGVAIYRMDSLDIWRSKPDEAVLAASLKHPSLYAIILERYEAPFTRKAKTIIRDEDAVMDAVQETFVRIYRYAGRFTKREGVAFKSWAYKILMNTTFTHYARLKRDASVSLEDGALNDADHAYDDSAKTEMQESVQSVLGKMPGEVAVLLRAHDLEGKPYEIIAKEQGLTLTALKMRLFRARKIFKKQFLAEAGSIEV